MNWMDDFEQMRRQWERLDRDLAPSIEMIRKLARQYDWSKVQRDVMAATIAAQDHIETLRRLAEPKYFADLSAFIAASRLDFDKLLAVNLFAYRDQSATALHALQSLKVLAGSATLSSAATDFMKRVANSRAHSTEATASSSDELEEAYLKEATALQLTPATAQFILSALLTLLLFWLSQRSSSESESNILDRIGRLEAGIEEVLNAIQVDGTSIEAESTRVVVRSTVVLTKPSGRQGKALGLVYAEQLVVIKTTRGKWCEIEWFDVRDRSLKLGWVRKKYLGRSRD